MLHNSAQVALKLNEAQSRNHLVASSSDAEATRRREPESRWSAQMMAFRNFQQSGRGSSQLPAPEQLEKQQVEVAPQEMTLRATLQIATPN